jgi:hypothetical protein
MGRSPKESLEAVKKLAGLSGILSLETPLTGQGPFLGREFWAALIRGGYQGGAYYIEKTLMEGI